jgi:uncharacterized protein YneF (UPF0154 family)
MSIQNNKSVVVMPLVLAVVLVLGYFLGVKLIYSNIKGGVLIYPRGG